MWSTRQVTHLPPVRDLLLPLAYTPLIDRVTWTTCHMLSCVVSSQSLARRYKVVKSPGHLVMGQS